MDRRSEDREITVQGKTVSIAQEFYWCPKCEAERITPEMMDEVLRRAVDVLRRADGLLSPDEIKTIRTGLGYNQLQFEAILGSGPKTVTRWERGTVAPSGAANRLLEVFRDNPNIAHEIAKRLGIFESATVKVERIVLASGLSFSVIRMSPTKGATSSPERFKALDLGQLQEAWKDDASAEAPEPLPWQGPRWHESSPRHQNV